MDHEYDDDRPTDRAGEVDHGDQAPFGANASDFAFDAPDLASAFLAALDEADDRLFASPPLDDLVVETPAVVAAASQPDPSPISVPEPDPVPFETPETMMLHGAIVDHDSHLDPAPAPMDESLSARAVAEAFAREQAALELWGSDEASAVLDSAASEAVTHRYPEPVDAIDSIEAIEASHASEATSSWAASIHTEAPLADLPFDEPAMLAPDALAADAAEADAIEADAPETEAVIVADGSDSPAELIAETVSNADSYYDPDTLRLTRPLFSPDEPRAFAAPVYVGDASEAAAEGAEGAADADAEVLEDLEEFLAFSLGDTRCVVPIRNVLEIGRIPHAVAVPNAPAWLHGLGNLRGQVLSLIDLRAFLGIGRVRPATGRMLVLRADDEEVQAGLLVDHVHQIVSLSASRFHPVPETLARHYARHAWGVCDYGNFTMIGLEVDSLLGVENMIALGDGAEVM